MTAAGEAAVDAETAQLQLLLPQGTLTRDGIVVVGAASGSHAFVEGHVRRTLFTEQADNLLCNIVTCRDTQLALALLRMCYVQKATFTMRNVAPDLASATFRRHDAAILCAFAAIIQEPTQVALRTADASRVPQ